MRIICPTCASHYEVETDKLEATGQLVRCAHCREVWLVQTTDATMPERPALPTANAPRPGREPAAFTASGAASQQSAAHPIDFETAKTRLRRRSPAGFSHYRPGSIGLLSIGAVCATALGLLVGLRVAVVTRLPAAAAAYAALGLPVNADGLALRDVRSVLIAEDGKTVLSLDGEIANLRDGPTSVPNLTVVVRDNAKVPLYTWTTTAPKTRLGKGETVAFHSRLIAPPSQGHDVHVSFAETGAVIMANR